MIGAPWFGGYAIDSCAGYGNDLCQLYELAYHVDAHDNAIVLMSKPQKR
jgi:hypothetical protein